MIRICGEGAVKGICIGLLREYSPPGFESKKGGSADPSAELQRFEQARQDVKRELMILRDKAARESGKESAAIFEAQGLLLEDELFSRGCRMLIGERGCSPEEAVCLETDAAINMLNGTGDPVMSARSADLSELKEELLRSLLASEHSGGPSGDTPGAPGDKGEASCILVADDLSPSDFVRLDKSGLAGLVLRKGNPLGHLGVLAAGLSLPTLMQCRDLPGSLGKKKAVLDGYEGCLYISPDPEFEASYRKRLCEDMTEREELTALKGLDSASADGRVMRIYANIDTPAGLGQVLDNDAEGIGLFRSEYLFLGRDSEPSEQEQYEAYRSVLSALYPRPVIIRTCDMGADKLADYMEPLHEENPALGCRGVRLSLKRRESFKRQLRSLLRAADAGDLRIMYPMITDVSEVLQCEQLLEECRRELKKTGKQPGRVQTGIMIETPAAALMADELAPHVSFFSIGTNDLTQYTCAADRLGGMDMQSGRGCTAAVMKLIDMSVKAAHIHGIRVGICGEMAGDTALTETFLNMGVDSLSVSPGRILEIRKVIRRL